MNILNDDEVSNFSFIGQTFQLKMLVRPMYSNPPLHGARLVAEILGEESMRQEWALECKGMADRSV